MHHLDLLLLVLLSILKLVQHLGVVRDLPLEGHHHVLKTGQVELEDLAEVRHVDSRALSLVRLAFAHLTLDLLSNRKVD